MDSSSASFHQTHTIVEKNMVVKSRAALLKYRSPTAVFLYSRFSSIFHDATLDSICSIWLEKQVALGAAYACAGVLGRFYRGVSAQRCDHEHILAVFAGAAASLFGAQRSDRQRSRRSLLPLPLLLPVSTKYGGSIN